MFKSLVFASALLVSSSAFAGGHINWKSVPGESSVSYGSIKKNVAGEVNTFGKVSGSVSEKGDMVISIDLSSVETNIDIRNTRMKKIAFQGAKVPAKITGKIDMSEVNGLKVGATTLVDVEGKLSFVGKEIPVEAEMLVARLSEDRVLVTTASMIMLKTKDLGVDAAVDELQKLAKLPGITRVSPVTLRMVFKK